MGLKPLCPQVYPQRVHELMRNMVNGDNLDAGVEMHGKARKCWPL